MGPLARMTGTHAWSWGHHNLCMICNWKSRLVVMGCYPYPAFWSNPWWDLYQRGELVGGVCVGSRCLDRASALGQQSKGSWTVITELCLAAGGLIPHHLMELWTRSSDVLSHCPAAHDCSQSTHFFTSLCSVGVLGNFKSAQLANLFCSAQMK